MMTTPNTPATIVKKHNGIAFTFRGDGWFNMTAAAKTFGRDLGNFMNAADTVAYAQAVHESLGGNSFSLKEYAKDNYRYSAEGVTTTGLVVAQKGRYGGTWAHPKLAVFFARWLDVKFSVWCDAVIEDILKGAAKVTIVKPQESAVMALPSGFLSRVESFVLSAH